MDQRSQHDVHSFSSPSAVAITPEQFLYNQFIYMDIGKLPTMECRTLTSFLFDCHPSVLAIDCRSYTRGYVFTLCDSSKHALALIKWNAEAPLYLHNKSVHVPIRMASIRSGTFAVDPHCVFWRSDWHNVQPIELQDGPSSTRCQSHSQHAGHKRQHQQIDDLEHIMHKKKHQQIAELEHNVHAQSQQINTQSQQIIKLQTKVQLLEQLLFLSKVAD